MKLICIHCGGEFTILAEHLGGKGRCPHCKSEITLPKAADPKPADVSRRGTTNLLENSISFMGSLAIHMTAMLVIALAQHWTAAGGSGEGTTNEVLIGVLPSQELSDQQEEAISTGDVQSTSVGFESEMAEELSTVEPTTTSSADAVGGGTNVGIPSPSSGGGGGFDLGPVNIGGSMAGGSGDGKTWGGMIQQLRRHGLDIVICFDSTGSMTGEIDQVKRQIDRIGTTLVTLVPKARISIVTYRDQGDEFVAKGMPLSGNIQDVKSYLSRIEASGGGDHPEAVDEGLRWAARENQFRPTARKVILIFGDAPPHEENLKKCLELASGFKGQQKGIVSTVTCRSTAPLPEFYEIARAGGGEAFLTSNQREIMSQLIVLVFGSRHRDKVLEAFKLLEE
ncbi:MAG TPA: vWA domain-containing protein [Pirellulaceae bacterium]|nr:vWA domain-containing protein [Pirellulaceae bacterium]